MQVWLLGSIWSLTNRSYLSSATPSWQRRGVWKRVSWRQKESENRIFGWCLSPCCHQTGINPVCGSFSIVIATFTLTFPEYLVGLGAHTLHICIHISLIRNKRGLECSRHLKFLNNTIALRCELTFTELAPALLHCPLKYICIKGISFSRAQLYANIQGQSAAEVILLPWYNAMLQLLRLWQGPVEFIGCAQCVWLFWTQARMFTNSRDSLHL